MSESDLDALMDGLAASGACGRALSLVGDHREVRGIYGGMLHTCPELKGAVEGLLQCHAALVECFAGGGKVLLCGNGGSHADALHIAGELLKAFRCDRLLDKESAASLLGLPFGQELAEGLRQGFPALVLGANGALMSAILNDADDSRLVFAQECYSLVSRGDALLAISTSGEAENVLMAAAAARARGATTLALVGRTGGRLAASVDYAIRAPGESTHEIQEYHVRLYHALCAGVEAHFYGADGCAGLDGGH